MLGAPKPRDRKAEDGMVTPIKTAVSQTSVLAHLAHLASAADVEIKAVVAVVAAFMSAKKPRAGDHRSVWDIGPNFVPGAGRAGPGGRYRLLTGWWRRTGPRSKNELTEFADSSPFYRCGICC